MKSARIAAAAMLLGMGAWCFGAEAPEAVKPAAEPVKADPAVDMATPTRITFEAHDVDFRAVLAEIAKITGNKGPALANGVVAKPVTVAFDKTPYWVAIDRLCKLDGLMLKIEDGQLVLVAAEGEPAPTSYAGPVMFKVTSVAVEPEDAEPPNAGKLKCVVTVFWEDRLGPSAFKPFLLESLTDGAGRDWDKAAGVEMRIGGMSSSGNRNASQRLELRGTDSWGTVTLTLPSRRGKGTALGEISGTFGLVKSGGKIELRIDNVLAEGEKSAEREGYKLTVTKADRRDAVVTVQTEFTKDGHGVPLPWPGRAGWSLVDADGRSVEGNLMGGRTAHFVLVGEDKGPYTLVRTYSPEVSDATYQFKFTQVKLPK